MKIGQNTANINASALFGNEGEGGLHIATGAKKAAVGQNSGQNTDGTNGCISASSLRLGENSIESRKQLARKQAMKVVGDAFEREKSMDRSLQEIKDNIERLNKDSGERKQQVKDNNDKLSELREQYGIEEGGEEDRKVKEAAMKMSCGVGLSQKEFEGLSEYGQRALYYESDNITQGLKIDENKAIIAANVQSETDLELARLKDHSMIDAQKEAEDIMDAANEDAIAMLTQEAVDHIDEKAEEEKEAAEKKAEEEKEDKKEAAKKEEQQAKIDELNARIRENGEAEAAEAAARGRAARHERENAGASDITNDAVQFDVQAVNDGAVNSTAQVEVKNILNKLSLLSEDIKGASVDDML